MRASDEQVANPRQCVVDADCGARAHADSLVCDHAGFCRALCADHWGDCNENYVDGCEVPIENRIYCPGDPRIGEYFPPSVILFQHDRAANATSSAFDAALEKHHAELTHCYERVLAKMPKLEGSMFYQFTLADAGRITSAKLVRSDLDSKELEACVAQLVANVAVGERLQGRPVVFSYQLELRAGHFNTDDAE